MILEALKLSIPVFASALEQFAVVDKMMRTDLYAGRQFTVIAYNLSCLQIGPGHALIVGMQLGLPTDPGFIRTKGSIGRVHIHSPLYRTSYWINDRKTPHPRYYQVSA